MDTLNLLYLSSCLFMVGLIWVIQLVHYPSFSYVHEKNFIDFEKFHAKRISFIVFPVMSIELITIIILSLEEPNFLYISSLVMTIVIWCSTFLLSMPCHKKLTKGKDLVLIEKLVKTNWIRTLVWTFKGGVFLCWIILT